MNVTVYNTLLKSTLHQKRFDQIWALHHTMVAQAERNLGVRIDTTLEGSDHSHWFGNCTATERERRSLRSADRVLHGSSHSHTLRAA